MTEIQLDKSTLPKNNQLVKWQTHQDYNNEIWKYGIFCEKEGLFLLDNSDFDSAFDVFRWEGI